MTGDGRQGSDGDRDARCGVKSVAAGELTGGDPSSLGVVVEGVVVGGVNGLLAGWGRDCDVEEIVVVVAVKGGDRSTFRLSRKRVRCRPKPFQP
jgi:hypothetical protein